MCMRDLGSMTLSRFSFLQDFPHLWWATMHYESLAHCLFVRRMSSHRESPPLPQLFFMTTEVYYSFMLHGLEG